jgi:hypothetical protein
MDLKALVAAMLIRRLNLPAASAPDAAVLDQRVARVAGLATLTAIFAGVVYSCELGFGIYAVPFAIPHAVFAGARSSRKWQAWGWAIAWVTIGLALVPTILTTLRIMRGAHHSEVAVLLFLMALLLTQTAQLIFVRRAFPGKIAFGTAVLRCTLYYVCWMIVVAATLPNWYVPPIVRRENKAMDSLRKYSTAMESYATTSKDASYPPKLSALAGPSWKVASSGMPDSELMCAQASCVKNGYRFEYHPVFKQERVAWYTINARPLEFEETGNRSFLLTADSKIYQTREDRDALLTDGER